MKTIYLHENIKELNEQYRKYGLIFEPKHKVIRLHESKPYVLQEYPELKERLRVKFGITYNKTDSWHIQGRVLNCLSIKK